LYAAYRPSKQIK
jgi:hypothetical protein